MQKATLLVSDVIFLMGSRLHLVRAFEGITVAEQALVLPSRELGQRSDFFFARGQDVRCFKKRKEFFQHL